jgi:GNAT superfamily N-acetyltransferase
MLPHSPETIVRLAQLEDFLNLVPLMKGFAGVRDDGLEDRFRRVVSSPDFVLVVAELEGGIVGYAMAQGYGPRMRSGEETVRLHDLMVSSEHRRRGVGRALFGAVTDWVMARGSRYLEWQSSTSGIAFYESLGLKGDPCPQPEYPFFEIDFSTTPSQA